MSALPNDLSDRLAAAREPLFARFTGMLFEKAGPDFLAAHDTDQLYSLASSAWEFFRRSLGRGPVVEVFNPEGSTEHTVVRVELSDRPFVVDSVSAEIRRHDYRIHHVLHPVYGVERDADGNITGMHRPGDGQNEAVELYFIDHEPDEQKRIHLATEIQRVLNDVIRATDAYRDLRDRARATAAYLRQHSRRDIMKAEEFEEYASFLDWLDDDNFVFLGYREYDITDRDGEDWLAVTPGSGLGILQDDSRSTYGQPVKVSDLTPDLRQRVLAGPILNVTKTNARSSVHRPVRMDYIGVKKLDSDGTITGERRFIGLFTSKAQATPVQATPVLRRKLRQVLELDGASRGSHDFKEIISIFDSLPREELFWNDAAQLHTDIRTIMSLDSEHTVRLSLRADPLQRGIGVIVVMPRDRFSGPVRRRVQRFLSSALRASHVDYQLIMADEGDQARLHFFFTTETQADAVDAEALERHVTDMSRSWTEDVRQRLEAAHGREQGRVLARRYAEHFDERYVADTTPAAALDDIRELEQLDGDHRVVLGASGSSKRHGNAAPLRVYHRGESMILSDVLPTLENAGLRVLEQTSYRVGAGEDDLAIEMFLVQPQPGGSLPEPADSRRLTDGLAALLGGTAESDGLNALLLSTSLDLRQLALIRAYAGYYSQVHAATSRAFLIQTLVRNPLAAEAIHGYFHARFNPDDPTPAASRTDALDALERGFQEILSSVTSLPEDQALRGIFSLVTASVRTNYYLGHDRISFKIESARVPQMPSPRPLYEIGVSASGVEGTHLRGGLVARGGIRWSDRGEDYRSEVLGLLKTQMTKNAVIVPVGSKGGFYLKNPPRERAQLLDHVRQQYQTYIRAMLDLTDNNVDGRTVHPEGLVIYDGPDPYLVVAADKGTATFSDLANQTAAEYGFWLKDAFASGGSHGYDHKKQGITARGAWESVSRHFRELGIDVHSQEFTAAGIGDMAGDVFGNGMLYTDRLRLQAAFNHVHIFLDPDPDPATSYAERQRLFTTPGSSWKDYRADLISTGGGVFDRAAKEIRLSPEVQRMLQVEKSVMSGQDLIRAVLSMPVDLLWNGGIGTYVKSSLETHADVSDSGNDGVRINATDLRARVVGEGGNLGFTQLARIEYARGGGRINTDAVDNAGGVDLSDHEVNIKILLQGLVDSGSLSLEDRNVLLEEMTPDVVSLVLRNNYRQSLSLSLMQPRAVRDPQLYYSLQEYLTDRGSVDPRVEYLPTGRQVQELQRAGQGYSRPELAILMAYVKMGLYRRLLETDFPEEPHFEHYLLEYFPRELVERYPEATRNHRLKREITATQFTNKVVDILGAAFVHRVIRDTDATPVEVIRAALVAMEILDGDEFVAQVFALDNQVAASTQYALLQEMVGSVEGLVTWILLSGKGDLPINEFVTTYRDPLNRIRTNLPRLLTPRGVTAYAERVSALTAQGIGEEIAHAAVGFDYLPSSVGIVEVAGNTGSDLEEAAGIFYRLGERLSLPQLRAELAGLPVGNKWEKIGLAGLVIGLRARQQLLTETWIRSGAGSMDDFGHRLAAPLQRYDRTLQEIRDAGELDFASGSVLLRILDQLQESAAA